MLKSAKSFCFVGFLLCVPFTSATAAEREDVRKVINLVTSVKMPFPESLSRNRAKTERVWLERDGLTVGCIRLEERRWCFEHIAPKIGIARILWREMHGDGQRLAKCRQHPLIGRREGIALVFGDIDCKSDLREGTHGDRPLRRVRVPRWRARAAPRRP